jgi:hypothetical protein
MVALHRQDTEATLVIPGVIIQAVMDTVVAIIQAQVHHQTRDLLIPTVRLRHRRRITLPRLHSPALHHTMLGQRSQSHPGNIALRRRTLPHLHPLHHQSPALRHIILVQKSRIRLGNTALKLRAPKAPGRRRGKRLGGRRKSEKLKRPNCARRKK